MIAGIPAAAQGGMLPAHAAGTVRALLRRIGGSGAVQGTRTEPVEPPVGAPITTMGSPAAAALRCAVSITTSRERSESGGLFEDAVRYEGDEGGADDPVEGADETARREVDAEDAERDVGNEVMARAVARRRRMRPDGGDSGEITMTPDEDDDDFVDDPAGSDSIGASPLQDGGSGDDGGETDEDPLVCIGCFMFEPEIKWDASGYAKCGNCGKRSGEAESRAKIYDGGVQWGGAREVRKAMATSKA